MHDPQPEAYLLSLPAAACESPPWLGMPGKMNQAQAQVIVSAELKLFLRPGRRCGPVRVLLDGLCRWATWWSRWGCR